MSTFSSLASAWTLGLGLTLKPIIIASDTVASEISDSAIVPLAEWTTFTLTSSFESLVKESFRASIEPWTSALIMRFKSFTSPSCMRSYSLSRLSRLDCASSFDRCFCCRCSLTCLASLSSLSAKNSSPAMGTPERPTISTGTEGPADSTCLPRSSSIARILP